MLTATKSMQLRTGVCANYDSQEVDMLFLDILGG